MSQEFRIASQSDLQGFVNLLNESIKTFGPVTLSLEPAERQRTLTQNRCLHLYCELLADALNDAGYDMLKVLKPGAEIPWTKNSVKEHLWKPIQQAMTAKASTTEPTTVEYQDVYRALDRHLSEKLGISVPWPTRFGEMA